MLRIVTAGESHGAAMAAIVEGLPHGVPVDLALIDRELARRQGGYGRGARMRIEHDKAEILAGVRHGHTTGAPVLLLLRNLDSRLEDAPRVTRPRPGHADFAGCLKYGLSDARDVLERASARDTAARTMAGALCACFLREFGIRVFGHVRSIGAMRASAVAFDAGALDGMTRLRDASPFSTLDPAADEAMKRAVEEARAAGDTLGGVAEVAAFCLPPGLGDHTQWERKLDGRIAQALMSIQAIKGVEIGLGFGAAGLPGSRVHDPILRASPAAKDAAPLASAGFARASNNAGGLEAGITNGAPLIVRAAMKPISTLMKPLPTVDLETGEAAEAAIERSDVCAVPAASVVAENVLAGVLAGAFLDKFGGDSLTEIRRNYEGYLASLSR